MKVLDQRARDRQRKTYRLAFPSDLDAERVLSWVRAFSGTLRGPRFQFTGAPALCFEMWATNEGIVHRLKVPWQHVEYILPQLHSLVPGIHVTPEDNYPYNKHWTRAVEAKLTGTSRTLRIYSPVDTSASLLASVAALEPGETVLLQWVVTPTPPKAAPIPDDTTSHKTDLWTVLNGNQANRDEVADRRKKLEEPNLVAVLRVAAMAETPVRADQLIHRVRASLAATRGPATRFIKRLLAQDTVRRRIQQSAAFIAPRQCLCFTRDKQFGSHRLKLARIKKYPAGFPGGAGSHMHHYSRRPLYTKTLSSVRVVRSRIVNQRRIVEGTRKPGQRPAA